MIRLSEIKLTLTEAEHPETPLLGAAARLLALQRGDIGKVDVFKRSFDARKAELHAVYIVDVTLADPSSEPALLSKFAGNPHITATPDMDWHPPVHAAAPPAMRPVV